MTYYLKLKQAGEGCDYTIACGQKCVKLESTTLDDAIQEATREHDAYDLATEFRSDGNYNNRYCDTIEILEVNETIDLAPMLKQEIQAAEEAKEEAEKEIAEDQEKAEFERLKEKFGE